MTRSPNRKTAELVRSQVRLLDTVHYLNGSTSRASPAFQNAPPVSALVGLPTVWHHDADNCCLAEGLTEDAYLRCTETLRWLPTHMR
jgi:hypothetical protein